LCPSAALIQKRSAPAEPFDIWYWFRRKQPEEELSKLTRSRYPTSEAYKKDIPRLLQGLGFSARRRVSWTRTSWWIPRAARGTRCSRAAQRDVPLVGPGDSPHLRTRVNPDGMDYKGYNIAIHEMGHNVEQVFSLYQVDDTLLLRVPGTAFTEALAFTFQHRDLELLGVARWTRKRSTRAPCAPSGTRGRSRGWRWWISTSGTDVRAPGRDAAQLREATVAIAKTYWDKYYAPVLGKPGTRSWRSIRT